MSATSDTPRRRAPRHGLALLGAAALAVALVAGVAALTLLFPSRSGDNPKAGATASPSVPATQFTPLSAWTDDGEGRPNQKVRLVRIGVDCFLESVSGDNGLDTAYTPATCPTSTSPPGR